MNFIYLSEGLRMLRRRVRVLFRGLKQYPGNADEIAKQIINDCYNKEKNYFMVSSPNGHFCEFYCRDFGWCTEALINLGYKKEVLNTLEYALKIFDIHGRIEQSISPSGKAFTFPDKYSPDALAFLIRSLKLAKAGSLIKKYKPLLNKEIKRYYGLVIDKQTGLVRKDLTFSSMKDHALRQSSCYDNAITGMLANDLQEIKVLDNPFRKYDYKNLVMKNFWNNEKDGSGYFLDDLSGNKIICGDANVIPFWAGLINDNDVLKKTIATLRKNCLDKPLPLKYAGKKFKEHEMISEEVLASGYERETCWAHVGFMYIKIVAGIDKKLAKEYLEKYKKEIERYKTFLELYSPSGKPFKTLLYYSDESMLWSANYLYLKKLVSVQS